jgi:hypothetical protein
MPYLAIGQTETAASFDSRSGPPSILLCPSDTQSGTEYDSTSYAYSACFYHTPGQIEAMHPVNLIMALAEPGPGAACVTQTQASIALPGQKILSGEWFDSHQYTGGLPIGYWGTVQASLAPGPDRWTGGRAYVFADGHAKFLQSSQQEPSADDCPDMALTPNGDAGSDLR